MEMGCGGDRGEKGRLGPTWLTLLTERHQRLSPRPTLPHSRAVVEPVEDITRPSHLGRPSIFLFHKEKMLFLDGKLHSDCEYHTECKAAYVLYQRQIKHRQKQDYLR